MLKEYKNVSVHDLVRYKSNARTHSSEQVQKIARSIQEFGFTNPLLIDEFNVIIAGHGRLDAAIAAGFNEVPCIVLPALTPEQKAALVIADNKIAMDAGWDMDILASEFDFLKSMDFDLTLTGFELDEIVDIFPEEVETFCDEDEAPEAPKEPVTRLGDVWLLGEHRLVCGDSTCIDTVNKLMQGNLADMVFTDPPYNIASENKGVASNSNNNQMKKLMGSDWDKNFNPNEMLNCLFTVLSENVTVYICTSHHLAPMIWEWMKTWSQHYSFCVWNKTNPMPSLMKRHWTWNTELICYATRGKHTFNFPEHGHALSVWDFSKVAKCDLHPTMKPVAIPEHAINHSSGVGQLVLDLFGGSGSTLIACEKLKRRCFMMELDPVYCDVIIQRWEKFTGKDAIHEETKKLYKDC